MEVTAIKQGDFKVDARKNFEYLQPGEQSKLIKMAVQPFVVKTSKDIVLLDTGLTFSDTDPSALVNLLREYGVDPLSVTKILISHLHKDHADGLGFFKDGAFIQNFPSAKIYIQKREYEYALQQVESFSYNQSLLRELIHLPNMVWLTEDEGNLNGEIRFKVTGGHTPFMQVFWISDGKQTCFYGADNLPTRGYLKRHLAFKTDYDGHKAMEYRKLWQKEAIAEHWTVLLYHDMETAVWDFKDVAEV